MWDGGKDKEVEARKEEILTVINHHRNVLKKG